MNTEPMNNSKGKDVIYIDIDDEITAIIDKVRSSHEKIVALVLPKRATMFQSIVNMKLLKRTADNAKKNLVLITSESGLLPLAGAVGIHVARTLQSKPEIPNAPNGDDSGIDDVEETASMAGDGGKDEALDTSRPVGEYARSTPPSMANPLDAEDDVPIELDNDAPAPTTPAAKTPQKKNKKLKIPDFNRFRVFTALGAVGLVVIILLWYVGFVVMPRATIAIKTDSNALNVNVDLTLDTDATEASIDAAMLPATAQQSQKTATQQAQATGEENRGEVATGSVTMTAKNCSTTDVPGSVAAGTGITANSKTFITKSQADFVFNDFDNGCLIFVAQNIPIEAQSAGAGFNVGSTSFSVVGRSDVSASGVANGGTDDIVKVLAQSDIDGAKQKLSEQDTEAIKQELIASLEGQDLYAVEGTFKAGDPQTSANAKAGDEVTSVTVTQKTTYTMLGVDEGDLKRLVANQVADEVDPDTQTILDHGLNDAEFRLQNQQGTDTLVTLETTVIAGSDLDLDKIKEQVAGKKANDAKELISDYPGVTEVTVDYSPFWVSSIPKSTGKIKVSVEKPSTSDGR